MAPKEKQPERKKRSAVDDVKTREYTIHLHKHVHDRAFKKRAPYSIKAIKAFAFKAMGTKDVRVDSKLNKHLWARGVKGVPHRVRVQLARKRNDSEDAKEKLYTLVTYVPAELTKSKRRGTNMKTARKEGLERRKRPKEEGGGEEERERERRGGIGETLP